MGVNGTSDTQPNGTTAGNGAAGHDDGAGMVNGRTLRIHWSLYEETDDYDAGKDCTLEELQPDGSWSVLARDRRELDDAYKCHRIQNSEQYVLGEADILGDGPLHVEHDWENDRLLITDTATGKKTTIPVVQDRTPIGNKPMTADARSLVITRVITWQELADALDRDVIPLTRMNLLAAAAYADLSDPEATDTGRIIDKAVRRLRRNLDADGNGDDLITDSTSCDDGSTITAIRRIGPSLYADDHDGGDWTIYVNESETGYCRAGKDPRDAIRRIAAEHNEYAHRKDE